MTVSKTYRIIPLQPVMLALGGGVATLRARPYAPWKELLSLMRKVPGPLSFNTAMATVEKTHYSLGVKC